MGGSRFQRKRRRPTMAPPPQLPTTIEKLPDHLLSNILIRVPARTLAQMRSVSKPLINALLSQPSFIKSHLHRSIKHNDEILLVFKYYISDQVTAHPSKSPHLELPNFIKLPIDPYDNPGDPYIGHELIGAVNGLICSYNVSNSFYYIQIWNPSISAVLELPDLSSGDAYRNRFRFGYDPNNDDYKVVRLSDYLEEPEDFVQVEVFSMRKGCWKLITESIPMRLPLLAGDKVCGDGHDGHLHWLCYVDDDLKEQTIVAMDLSSETMSEICLPVDNNSMDRQNVIGVLGGKLCLMSCLKDHDCEVWLMNEYGNAESWAKHHVFSQFRANISPFGFTLSNEFVFAAFNVLSLFDPVADKVKSFMFVVETDTRIVPYVDSLVWITPDKS